MENSSLLVLVENSTQSCANFINNYTERIVIKSTDLSNEHLKNSVFTKAVIEAENKDILEKLAAVAFDVLGAGAEIYIFSNDLAVTKRKLRIAGFSIEDGENFPVVGKKTVMAGSKVTLKLPEASKEDDDIVDEDALLEEDDFKKPTAEQLSAGCAPPEDGKKRRACKNCSCGLAEQEEKQKMESISSAPKSSCGNCALGDAFRCSTCPYLGQPPFKPGETVKIANFDDF